MSMLFLAYLPPLTSFSMHLKRNYLAALISFSAALFCRQAQAQTPDSASQDKPQTTASRTDEPAKTVFKPIRIVCASSIAASRSPIFVVDGKMVLEQDIKSINPNNIDKIDILKDVAATSLYGSRAANGAVLITMKHRASKYIPQPEEKKDHLD
jgi:TonB-dependent SusC/RagA subfamily outer membrane receptor